MFFFLIIVLLSIGLGTLCSFLSFTTFQKEWLERKIDLPLTDFQELQGMWKTIAIYIGLVVTASVIFVLTFVLANI